MAKRECDGLVAAASHEIPELRWHDLRHTVRTNLARLRVPGHVAELVVGHQVRGLRAVYDRHAYLDEKRKALDAWSSLLCEILDPTRAGNVVNPRR
jgi:integrase